MNFSTRLRPREDAYLALVTGNYESRRAPQAGILRSLEILPMRRDSATRRRIETSSCPGRWRPVEACGGPAFTAADTIVIGDTPLDVGCAAHVGARSLAIATGSHQSTSCARREPMSRWRISLTPSRFFA